MTGLFGFVRKYNVWFPGLTALLVVFADTLTRANPHWIGHLLQPSLVAETIGGVLLVCATSVFLFRSFPKRYEKGRGEKAAASLVVFWSSAAITSIAVLRALYGIGVEKIMLLAATSLVAGILMAWVFEAHLRDCRAAEVNESFQRHWLVSKSLLPIGVGCYFYYETTAQIAYAWIGFTMIMIAYLVVSGLIENKNSFEFKVSTG